MDVIRANFLLVALASLLYCAFTINTRNTVVLLTELKLPSQSHRIVTDDGYILRIFRIPNHRGTPVLFVHGLLGSSDAWLLKERNENIATILYDLGYDIWLINLRGNEYSRNHVSMKPDTNNQRFWNFSLHELGVSDVPSTVSYILNVTKHSSLLYVGHSMGTTLCIVACSENPEFNRKIKAAILLAPSAYTVKGRKPPFVQFFIDNADFFANFLYSVDVYELLGQGKMKKFLINSFCYLQMSFCARLFGLVSQHNLNTLDADQIPYYMGRFSSGTSVKLYQHVAQIVSPEGNFTNFNYGRETNRLVYGKAFPPKFHVEKMSVPIALIHSVADPFLDMESINKLRSKAKNVIFDYEIPDLKFQHMDYLIGLNLSELVTSHIVRIFEKYK